MKIYLASSFCNRLRLHPIRERLTEMGHVVTSRWLDEPANIGPVEAAQIDCEDIRAADALVLWPDSLPTAGKYIEFGYALALGKELYVVDFTCPSIFLMLPPVTHLKNWDHFFTYIKEVQ